MLLPVRERLVFSTDIHHFECLSIKHLLDLFYELRENEKEVTAASSKRQTESRKYDRSSVDLSYINGDNSLIGLY